MTEGQRWVIAMLMPALLNGGALAAQAAESAPMAVPQNNVPEQNRNFNLTDQWREERRNDQPAMPLPGAQKSHSIRLSEKELLQHPQLLGRMMLLSLLKQDVAGVRLLLPLYVQLPDHDPLMAQYGEGLIAQEDGNFASAIEKYRGVLERDAALSMVRFSLAVALFMDSQLNEARAEFKAIGNDPRLPQELRAVLEQFEKGIDRQTGLKVDASLSYVSDPNVNNAPSQRYIDTAYGRWTLPEPQSAHGARYYLGLRQDTPLSGHFHWRNQAYVFGKYYWDKHDYDDTYSRVTSGIAWRNARHEISVMPFFAYRWFGTEPYSQTAGLRAQESYFINRDWQILAAAEYGRLSHKSRTFLNGHSLSASLSVVHRLSDRQYLVLGTDVGKQTAADSSEAYDYYGLRLGHMYAWPLGITSQIDASALRRKYRALNFFNVIQSDKDYSATLSLWKSNWSWRGFTPRLTFEYRKVDSNYVLAAYSKKQFGVQIRKEF